MTEDARLAAALPYDTAELQQRHSGCSPRTAYAAICADLRCKPVATVADMLPCEVGAWDAVTALDLSLTYVGTHGALAVIELCRCLPALRALSLADNYLSNETVWHLVQMALHHPSLERVDVSRNEFVSWTGAMCLAELVLRNPNITHVDLKATTVAADIVESIKAQARMNMVAKFRSCKAKPCPPVHPAAVYIRSMKLYYLKHQRDGRTADAAFLESGREELLRVAGVPKESAPHADRCVAMLRARAPAGVLTLEAFLVLLLIDGSTYDEATVERLKHIFVMFNVDATVSDPLYDGFVLASDLADMMEYAYGSRPSSTDVATVQRRLSLSADTTLKWGEFLYLAYPRGPQLGDRLCGMTATPLPIPLGVMHY